MTARDKAINAMRRGMPWTTKYIKPILQNAARLSLGKYLVCVDWSVLHGPAYGPRMLRLVVIEFKAGYRYVFSYEYLKPMKTYSISKFTGTPKVITKDDMTISNSRIDCNTLNRGLK